MQTDADVEERHDKRRSSKWERPPSRCVVELTKYMMEKGKVKGVESTDSDENSNFKCNLTTRGGLVGGLQLKV